jgi:hypothetical protein
MREVENLDQFLTLIDSVVDQDGRMQKLTHIVTRGNGRSDVRKLLQKLDVVEKRGTEAVRGCFIVGTDPIKNIFEIC